MASSISSLTLPTAIFASPAASILLPIALGTAVGLTCQPKDPKKHYAVVKGPPYRPPTYVFGSVWTILYGLMGFAAHRAYSAGIASTSLETQLLARQGCTIYTIQLGFNLLWTPLFFVAKRSIEATVLVAALTCVVGYLVYIWGQVDAIAGWALVPYVGWLGFATYLTAGVGYLNEWDISSKEIDSSPGRKAE